MRAYRWALCIPLVIASASIESIASAGTLRIDADQLPCRDRKVASAIEQRVDDLMAAQPDLTLEIRALSPRKLELILTGPSGTTRRELDFRPADCAAITRTVSLLVRGWLGRRWEYTAPVVAAPARDEEPPREPVLATIDVEPPRPAAAPPSWHLLLLGGASASPDGTQLVPSAKLAADWDATPSLGASFHLAFDGPFAGRSDPGAVAASVWGLSAAARWTVRPLDAARLDLLAGLGLDVVAARASGFSDSGSSTLAVATAAIGVRWTQRLSQSLAAVAGVDFAVREREQVFYIRNIGEVFTLSPMRARVLAGISWTPN